MAGAKCFASGFMWTLVVLSATIASITAEAPMFSARQDSGIDDEYLVVLKRAGAIRQLSELPERLLREILARFEEKYDIKPLRLFRIGTWQALLVSSTKRRIDEMLKDRDVAYVESNQMVRAVDGVRMRQLTDMTLGKSRVPRSRRTSSKDKCTEQGSGSSLWGLTRISSRGTPKYKSGSYKYTSSDNGRGTDIYVVDTGVRLDHEEFDGRASLGYLASGLEKEGPDDVNGHGTHVASIAAGKTTGVAKGSHVISVKVLGEDGSGQISWTLEGLEWVVNRVLEQQGGEGYPRAVINLSLGSETIVYAMDQAVQAAVSAGVSVVVAAGNEYSDACGSSPGRVSSAVTVGATNDDDYMTSFSNYGSCVDILAPGDEILGASHKGHDSQAVVSGTSQAAPFVAGVMARYLSSIDSSEHDVPSPPFLKAVMTDTASKGRVSFNDVIETSTPNLLVYRSCDFLNDSSNYPPMPSNVDDGASSVHGRLLCEIVALMLLALFVIRP